MVSINIAPSERWDQEAKLVHSLAKAAHALRALARMTDRAMVPGRAQKLEFCPQELKKLSEILVDGQERILRRIAELGWSPNQEAQRVPAPENAVGVDSPLALLAEFRNCCRDICTATKEAENGGDPATFSMLGRLSLRLEKQLWLIDKAPQSRRQVESRTVSLFLAC